MASSGASLNSTITLPPGTTNHGDPNLLCTPASWADIAIFFLGNYVAHAATVVTYPGESPRDRLIDIVNALLMPNVGVFRATVVTYPGESPRDRLIDIVNALLMPNVGVFRALRRIHTWAKFGSTDLEVACRAGAVVTLVYKDNNAMMGGYYTVDDQLKPKDHPNVSTGAERESIVRTGRGT